MKVDLLLKILSGFGFPSLMFVTFYFLICLYSEEGLVGFSISVLLVDSLDSGGLSTLYTSVKVGGLVESVKLKYSFLRTYCHFVAIRAHSFCSPVHDSFLDGQCC